jgi:hypothetical protein
MAKKPKREATFAREATITKEELFPLDTPDAPMRREVDKREGEEGSPHPGAAEEGAIWRVLEAQSSRGQKIAAALPKEWETSGIG